MLIVQLFMLEMVYAQSNAKENHVTVVVIKDYVSSLTDTAWINYQPNLSEPALEHKMYYAQGNPAIFTFSLNDDIGRVKVFVKGESKKSLPLAYVEKGDSILIKISGKGKETTGQFIGPNNAKFSLKGVLDSISLHSGFFLDSARMRAPEYIETLYQDRQSEWKKKLTLLEVLKPKLTKKLQDLYKAEINGEFFSTTNGFSFNLLRGTNFERKLLPTMNELLKLPLDTALGSVAQYSWEFMQGLQDHIKLRFAVDRGRTPEMRELYYALKTQLSEKWSEPVVYYFLKNVPKGKPEDFEACITDALVTFKDRNRRKTLNQILSARSRGSKAYNFSLTNERGKVVNLKDFKGKIVLLDFWFTGCPGCINLSRILDKQVLPIFKNKKDFVYITINIDKNKKIWQNSIATGKYTSTKYVNLNINGMANDSPVINHYKVEAFPTLILIDREGRILNANIDSFNISELVQGIEDALLQK